jgi:multidrug efflux system outer membrane protein
LLGENPAAILREATTDKNERYFPAPPEVPLGLPAALIERRPDIRQSENTLIGANARLQSVKASLFPTVSLTGAYGSQSAALSSLFTGPAKIWSFGLGLLQPIIDVNRNTYQVDVFTARERAAIAQYQQTVGQAFREVSDALAARQGASESLVALDEQVAALRAAREQVLKRYNIGFSSYFEVIDAEQSLYQGELARVAVYRNTLNALVSLYKALGGGWEIDADERTGVVNPRGMVQPASSAAPATAAPAPAR